MRVFAVADLHHNIGFAPMVQANLKSGKSSVSVAGEINDVKGTAVKVPCDSEDKNNLVPESSCPFFMSSILFELIGHSFAALFAAIYLSIKLGCCAEMARELPPIAFEPALRGVSSIRYTSHFQKKKRSTLCTASFYGDEAGTIPVLFEKKRKCTLAMGKNAGASNEVEILREKLMTRIEFLFAEHGNAVPSTQVNTPDLETRTTEMSAVTGVERYER